MNRSPAPIRLATADMLKRFESIRAGLAPASKGRRSQYTRLEALLMTAFAAGALGAVLRLPPDKTLQAEPATVLLAPLPSVPLRISGIEMPSRGTSAFPEAAYADGVLTVRSIPSEPPIDKPRAEPPRSPSDAPAGDLKASAAVYAVQVGAPDNRPEADRIADRLTLKGYEVSVQVPPGRVALFRVRVGPFNTRLDADAAAARLRTEEHFDPWVVLITPNQSLPAEP